MMCFFILSLLPVTVCVHKSYISHIYNMCNKNIIKHALHEQKSRTCIKIVEKIIIFN